MSFAIITSRPNFIGSMSSGHECSSRICRPLSSQSYSGTAKQLFQRGVVFLGSSAILFVIGALLTGLGYYAVLSHVARALGPMCIALAMLLVIVAARYLTIARRLTELAQMAESQEISANANGSEGHTNTAVNTIAENTDGVNSNQNMNETYGFRFQPADFLPPPAYETATQHNTQSSNTPSRNQDTISLSEQEPPPPYSEAIKTQPVDVMEHSQNK